MATTENGTIPPGNVTNFEIPGTILKQSIPVIVILVISYFVVFILCVVGNSLVCFIVAKIPRMRTVTNYFILNLAASDILVAVFCMPFTLVDNIIIGGFCYPLPFQVGSYRSFIQALMEVAEEYYAIVYPTTTTFTGRITLYVTAGVWMLSLLLMIPQVLLIRENAWVENGQVILTLCQETSAFWRKIYTTVLFICCFIIPLTVIMYLYAQIGLAVWFKPTPGGDKATDEAKAVSLQRKMKVIKMLLTVVVLFALSWLPIHVITMINDYGSLSPDQLDVLWIYVYPACHWLIYLNSAINPIIYGFFNQNFRAAFRTLMMMRGLNVSSFQSRMVSQGTVIKRSTRKRPLKSTTAKSADQVSPEAV
ncbi:neuropeptide FF receptor 2-like [Branchiostoma floridae]|uniref:Neuropeptide FF receptor 2-like n=1 Tax=Branchiostoma floridae TaxID=7739 RepID=A0A9J7MK29_BRAFL|nr:neuropeptide FF receptor 2-like [Branchiostoma floridae]